MNENLLEVNVPDLVETLKQVAGVLNLGCGRVTDFFSNNAGLQPTKELNQKYPEIADKIVEQLEQAARHGVVFVDPSVTTLVKSEKKLPPELRTYLERTYSGRGYIKDSTVREPLVSSAQSKLPGSGGRSILQDNRIGRETARALLEDLRNQGFVESSPCIK
jgi:hypothetical protein